MISFPPKRIYDHSEIIKLQEDRRVSTRGTKKASNASYTLLF